MPLYFNINGQKPNGFLPKTSFGLAAERLSCALPRLVPHYGEEKLELKEKMELLLEKAQIVQMAREFARSGRGGFENDQGFADQ
jgi:hypothetical protein